MVLNARDAAAKGAQILVGTKVISARRDGDFWQIETESVAGTASHQARVLVNAAGPWVAGVIADVVGVKTADSVRLVRGSHVVVKQLYDHDRAYFFQGGDGRIIFAIPYEQGHTLIGTIDQDHQGAPLQAHCSDEERDYILSFANNYFEHHLTADDVVWTYSGVRPLYNDGASSATAATRDYVLKLDQTGAPLLNIFGGKITTYRRLAESALQQLTPFFPQASAPWTAGVALPGGDFAVGGVNQLVAQLRNLHPSLDAADALRLVRTYGTEAVAVLKDGPGRDFGGGLSEAEVRWQMAHEWARRAEDVVWRRTKLGLRMTADEIAALDAFMQDALH